MRFQGRILTRLPGRREVDRRGERLPTVWIRSGKDVVTPSTQVLVRDASRTSPTPPTSGVLIVMLSGDCPEALQMLLSGAQAGLRVYVLAPPGWGEGPTANPLASVPRAQVLVRRIAGLPATAVWGESGAWLWTGSATARPTWRLALTAEQTDALRLAMLQLFWHHGLDEAWQQDGAMTFRPCADRPYDVPAAAPDSPVRLVAHGAADPLSGEIVYLPINVSLPRATERAWVPPSGNGHEGHGPLRASGVTVAWHDFDLPACSLDRDHGRLQPESARWAMSIALDPTQRSDLRRLLTSEPSWHFEVDAPLGEIERAPDATVWLPGASAPAPLRPHETLQAGEAAADSLRGCATTEPKALPAPSPLALRVEWAWGVLPPRKPAGATDDPLVRAWREFDANFQRRVDAAKRQTDALEARTSDLARTFETLRAAMMGFGRTRSDLATHVTRLSTVVPSKLGADGASAELSALRAVEAELAGLTAGMDAEERRAREERERAEQRAAFDGAARQIREDLGRHSQERDAKRQELTAIEAALGKAIEDAAEGGGGKDGKAAQRKLRDDQTRMQKRVQWLDEAIAGCERKLAAPFEYRPSAQVVTVTPRRPTGAAFVPPAGGEADLHVPVTSLPSVGRLTLSGKQRFLGIQHWDELDDGEQEAARLSARLVAEVEAP